MSFIELLLTIAQDNPADWADIAEELQDIVGTDVFCSNYDTFHATIAKTCHWGNYYSQWC